MESNFPNYLIIRQTCVEASPYTRIVAGGRKDLVVLPHFLMQDAKYELPFLEGNI
jgi:hypothetical protein